MNDIELRLQPVASLPVIIAVAVVLLGLLWVRPRHVQLKVKKTKTLGINTSEYIFRGLEKYTRRVFIRNTKVFVDIYEYIRIMARMARSTPRPTDAELAILRVLWERGPSTVRQVHDALSPARDTGYTTSLKLMQIMAEKGLVTRDASARTHVYTATEFIDGGDAMRWLAVTVPESKDGPAVARKVSRAARSEPEPMIPGGLGPASTAAQALDRIDLPQEAIDRISQSLTPGTSLIVSDHGNNREMRAYGTDFIVLTR